MINGFWENRKNYPIYLQIIWSNKLIQIFMNNSELYLVRAYMYLFICNFLIYMRGPNFKGSLVDE